MCFPFREKMRRSSRKRYTDTEGVASAALSGGRIAALHSFTQHTPIPMQTPELEITVDEQKRTDKKSEYIMSIRNPERGVEEIYRRYIEFVGDNQPTWTQIVNRKGEEAKLFDRELIHVLEGLMAQYNPRWDVTPNFALTFFQDKFSKKWCEAIAEM